MAEAKTVENPSIWGPRDIANNANNWTLASDASLLRYLESFSEKLLAQASETNDKLDNLLTALDETSLSLDLARNEFSSLSNTQFIESRIYEDDEIAENQPKSDENDNEVPKVEGFSKEDLKKAALKGLEVIDKYFDKVEVPHSDSEDETDFPSYVLRPKDLYLHRPLPYVIGTDEWYKSPSVGLGDSSSDSEEDNVSEKYSDDSESEIEIPKVKEKAVPLEDSDTSEDGFEDSLRRPVANSTFNDTRNEVGNITGYNAGPVQAPLSQQVFAEELAKKLGKALEENEPDINRKPIQKPQSNYGKLFSEEPPPIEENDDDLFAPPEKKHGIFSGGDGLFDDLEDDVSFWGGETVSKKSESASSERNKVIPNLFDDEPDDIFVKPKPTMINNNFKAELDKKLKPPKNLFDESSSSDEEIFANNIVDKHSNNQRIATSTEKAPSKVSHKPSVFDDDDGSSDDMFSTNKRKEKNPANFEEKSSKPENLDQRKAPIGGVKVMANPNFLQDKEFNKLLKTRKQYSSDTSSEDKEEIEETNGRKEETKTKIVPETKKSEDKAKISEEITPKNEETSVTVDKVVKIPTESKKISLFDDDDDDLFKDDLFSSSGKKKVSSDLFAEDGKTKNLFDDTSKSIFDDDILITTKKENQPKKVEEIPKKNVIEKAPSNDKPKMQKKALSLFEDEDEDSDDLFSLSTKKPDREVKLKEETSRNTGNEREKISLFGEEDEDIFSSNFTTKKDPPKKPQSTLFFDEPEEENLFEAAKKPGLFNDDDLFLDKSRKKPEEIVESEDILKKGDKIEKTSEFIDTVESIFEEVKPRNEESKETTAKLEEEELKIDEAESITQEVDELEVEEETAEKIFEEIKETKSNSDDNLFETRQIEETPKLVEESTKEIEESTPKKKIITRRIIEESEYDFEPQTNAKPEVKTEENNETPEEKSPKPKEETVEEIPGDIPPVKNIFDDDSPPNDIFADLTAKAESIPSNEDSSSKSLDRRLLFDSSPPPEVDTWEPDNFEDDIYSFDNTESVLGGQRSSIFDREPPSLFLNQSSGIVTDQGTRLEADTVSSFYPYACSSRRFSADTFAEDYSDDSLFKKNSHTISNIPSESSSRKIEEVSSFLDLTPSGKYSELYSEITERDLKPRKSVTFDDDVKKFGGEYASLEKGDVSRENVVGGKIEAGDVEEVEEGLEESTEDLKKEDAEIKEDLLKIFEGKGDNRAPKPLPKPTVPARKNNLKELDGGEIPEAPPTEAKEKSSPGKLKHNLNINVQALLPGVVPLRPNSSRAPRPTTISAPSEVSERMTESLKSRVPFQLPRLDLTRPVLPFNNPNVQKTEKVDPEVLQSVTKTRARIPNRRPSTKRGREAFRKSCVDFVVIHDEEDPENQPPDNQAPGKSTSLPSSPIVPDFLKELSANLEVRSPSPSDPPPALPKGPPPPMETMEPSEIPQVWDEQDPEKRSFVKTDDFASPEFFDKPDLFDENENDDDLFFSEKQLPPKSTILTTSLFGDDEDDDDFLQNVGATKRSEATQKPELSSVSTRRPKSVVLKKLDNVEVTDDPLSAFDQ